MRQRTSQWEQILDLAISTKGDSHGTSCRLLLTFLLDEPTWRCHQNPFVGALRIQEPVILTTDSNYEETIYDMKILINSSFIKVV
jgi:hypothetical protein